MNYVNYLVTSKFAKGTDGHLDANDLVERIKNHDGSEAYYNHFDVPFSGLKVAIDTGKTIEKLTPDKKKYHKRVIRTIKQTDEVNLADGEKLLGITFKDASGPCKPAFGLVGFDFDDEESPENSLRDVKSFLNYFRFEHFYVAYSGSKGFHISVPFEYFGLPADEHLPKTLRNLAHELKPHFKTLDTSVYNIGRKFRAPNTKHGKTGLYKTIISGQGIDTNDIEAIKEYCKTRRDHMYEPREYDVQPNETLTQILEQAKATASYDASKVGSASAPTRLEEYDGKVCIKRLFEAEIDEGERNTTALILINDLFKSGKAREHCINVMTPWITRVMPEHRRAEVFEMIDDIYKGDRYYNHGCLEPIKSKHCSAKCPLWRKLSPDKRPVPVDAPKSAYKDATKPTKLPPTSFISSWFQTHNVHRTLAGVWYCDNHSTMVKVIVSKMLLDYDANYTAIYKKVTKELIHAYIDRYIEQSQYELLEELKDRIRYNGENKHVETFLKALTGECSDLDVQVLKHCLWQVKRKMWGSKVTWHMMAIISGKTGTGKSVALQHLMKPLEDVTDYAQMNILNDERENFRFYENFVMIFDEMVKAGKTDVNALKNRMTSEYAPQRALHTQIRDKWVNNCTFFGTSNDEVKDIIKDPTSARRYYQFTVNKKCDWETLNKLNFIELWQSIDENKDTPYIEGNFEELATQQEKIRHKDLIEEWLDLYELAPEDNDEGVQVKATDAYDAYMSFRKKQNIMTPYTMTRFGRVMTNLVGKTRLANGVHYKLSKNFGKSNVNYLQSDASISF